MKWLIPLLHMPKVIVPAVAGIVLIGGTAVNAATGGAVVQTFTGSTSPDLTPVAAATVGTLTPTPGASDTPTPSSSGASATATPTSGTQTATVSLPGADNENFPNGGGGHNVIHLVNQSDNVTRVDGRIQVNHINGPTVAPVNEAYAYSSCLHCQSFSVALQINLYDNQASNVQPQNVAIALNYKCDGCTTVAKAIQYDVPVADPSQVPDNVRSLVNQMNAELNSLRGQSNIDATTAETDIQNVINQFQGLAQYLSNKVQKDTSTTNPNATPQATGTITPTVTETPSASATPDTATPTATVSTTPTPSASATPTPTASPTPTATP